MMEKKHLKPEILEALKNGTLSEAEAISALEHIGECERCAESFAGAYREAELLQLPPGFRPAVFSAVDNVRREMPAVKAKNASKRRELFRYSFRVSIAACITLVLLFSGTINYAINLGRAIRPDLSGVNVITEDIRGFSDKLVEFEVTKYFKEEQ